MFPAAGKTFIIAEAGKGFIQTEQEETVAEQLERAKELVRLAKHAGADAIKFQTHTVVDEQANITVVSPHFKGADRYAWVSRNERATPLDTFWKPLQAYCNEQDIVFFSTPMSRESAKKLASLGVPFYKVGSGDLLDFVLLDFIAEQHKPLIISTGMSTLAEIDEAVAFLQKRNVEFSILHCVSKYPCPPEELNLATMQTLRDRYHVPIGFSDHSIGVESALVAVALGATIIEKHFSTSRTHWGSDHKVSMLPDEFAEMVRGIRDIETHPAAKARAMQHAAKYLGTPGKTLDEGEAAFRAYFRKTLAAARDLPSGTVLDKNMVVALRPQAFLKGMPSEKYEAVLGKKLARAVQTHEPLHEDLFSSKF